MGVIEMERRVYTPQLDEIGWRFENESFARDGSPRRLMVGALMTVVVAAVGGVTWNLYSSHGEPPLVRAPQGEFKVLAPEAPVDASADREVFDVIEGEPAREAITAPPVAEEPIAIDPADGAAPSFTFGGPRIAAQGAFMVQLAAVRTEASARESWRGFSARAPGLTRAAKVDIQRADLGAQGVFYRLRAGFFTTRADASAYCAAASAAQQDCMVVAR